MQADKRYYPKNRDGVFDEWAAIAKNQYETATMQHNQKKIKRRAHIELEYGRKNYIDNIHKQKQEKILSAEEGFNERRKSDQAYEQYLRDEYEERQKRINKNLDNRVQNEIQI